MSYDYDIAIVGGGAGGLSLAAGASQLGLRVVLFEAHKMGGDCLNYGCVPSKSLLAVAKRVWDARHAEGLGYSIAQDRLDFSGVMAHVHKVITRIAVHDSVERFEDLGVTVVSASAHFVSQEMLEADGQTYQARHIVLATGSSPGIPPIPGLQECMYHSNETIFSLESLPKHLLVIGGGPIGLELSQAFAMLGSRVSLFEAEKFMPRASEKVATAMRKQLEDVGIAIYDHCRIIACKQQGDTVMLSIEHNGDSQEIEGSTILVAAGRVPNTDSLHCEKANIQRQGKAIMVNHALQTTNKRVFAIGDVNGGLQFTHVANAQASLLLKRLAFKLPVRWKADAIPSVIYTHKEWARVGLSEGECQAQDIAYKSFHCAYEDNDRALTEGMDEGWVELLLSPKGKLLGVDVFGHNAGELIAPWVTALREKASLRRFTDTTVAYPSLMELNKRVAGQFYIPKLFSSKTKRLVRFLQKMPW